MKKFLCVLFLTASAFALPKIYITYVSANSPVSVPNGGTAMSLTLPAGYYSLSAHFQIQNFGQCYIADANGSIVNPSDGAQQTSGGVLALDVAAHFSAADTATVICNNSGTNSVLGSGSFSATQVANPINVQ